MVQTKYTFVVAFLKKCATAKKEATTPMSNTNVFNTMYPGQSAVTSSPTRQSSALQTQPGTLMSAPQPRPGGQASAGQGWKPGPSLATQQAQTSEQRLALSSKDLPGNDLRQNQPPQKQANTHENGTNKDWRNDLIAALAYLLSR